MKRLLLIALLFSFWTGVAHAATQQVYIVNKSTVVHDTDIANALPAFQYAVSNDFARFWGQDAQLVITDKPPATGWTVTIRDKSDQWFALGYHGVYSSTPYARAFAQTSLDVGYSWQGVLTHELFEMLADPYINRLALGTPLWLVEVADPVEDNQFNYSRAAADGSPVPISDFVCPSWYRKRGHRPFDFAGHVRKPGQILLGGYAMWWETDGWHRIYGVKR